MIGVTYGLDGFSWGVGLGCFGYGYGQEHWDRVYLGRWVVLDTDMDGHEHWHRDCILEIFLQTFWVWSLYSFVNCHGYSIC